MPPRGLLFVLLVRLLLLLVLVGVVLVLVLVLRTAPGPSAFVCFTVGGAAESNLSST